MNAPARTRIKICGLTTPQAAQAAVAAGADAIGLIFHPPSARHLQLAQAAAIGGAVGPFVGVVAVMVNPEAGCARAIIERVNPTMLQFHGEEPADFCAGFGKPYIKTLRVAPATTSAELRALESSYASASGILLDTHAADAYGGTGAVFDWRRARYGGALPLLLAGGLAPRNVAAALAEVAPWAVDVSSGVETNGRKDTDKIRRFCGAVYTHDQSKSNPVTQ